MKEPITVLTKRPNTMSWSPKTVSTLKDMQSIVDGCIECISLPKGIDLWVNEEGLLNDSKLNMVLIWENNGKQPIFGAAFLAGVDDEGEMLPLSDEQRIWLSSRVLTGFTGNGEQVLAMDLTERGRRS
jgi:hypothetical protein